jgi:type III pantothenate kinase
VSAADFVSPPCWLVDLGHSRVKWAALDAGGAPGIARSAATDEFLDGLTAEQVRTVVLAAVPSDAAVTPLIEAIDAAAVGLARIGLGEPRLPVAPAYDSLGVDRWLAFNAAWARQPGPLCVVDVGTATTVDVVDARGRHCGGWILPGAEAARAGLLARAPGLERPREPSGPARSPACNTAQALERGLVLQQAGAIRLAIESAAHALKESPRVVLTGGGAAAVQSELVVDERQPDLVLHGLALAVKRMELDR